MPVTICDSSRPTPAAIVSGHTAVYGAPHPLLVFDMFRIGIGPFSSHMIGPTRTGLAFATELTTLSPPRHVTIDLFGFLGAIGRSHSTDHAILPDLAGYNLEIVDVSIVESILPTLANAGTLMLPSGAQVTLDVARDIRFVARMVLPYHVNALTITATDTGTHIILRRAYYSVGGGFVMAQANDDTDDPEVSSLASGQTSVGIDAPASYPFTSGSQLLAQCDAEGKSIVELVRANEEAARPRETLDVYLGRIADTIFDCVDVGTSATGALSGGLDAPRRAQTLAGKLAKRLFGPSAPATAEMGQGGRGDARAWVSTTADPTRAVGWTNLFALAINEENVARHRAMTAPTNGAAGVIPVVLGHSVTHCPKTGSTPGVTAGPDTCDGSIAPPSHIRLTDNHAGATHEDCDDGDEETLRERRRAFVHDLLLAATAIGILIKTNVSIAGVKVSCQGEVGSASAMAAAGLAQVLGESPQQVENAVEIATEHSLGFTCDPVAEPVQVPCIERNAIAIVKAINTARMALWGDGCYTVSLDVVIEAMRQTGNDMFSKYEETSEGGLAVNVVEC